MGVYATINLSFEFMALLLSLAGLFCVFLFPHFGKREKWDFALLLSLLVVSALFNGLFTIYGEKGGAGAKSVLIASRFISIAVGCWFGAAFYLYLYHLFDRKDTAYRVWFVIAFAVAGLLTASLIGNLFGGYYYSFDAEGNYSRGVLYYLIPTIECLVWAGYSVLVWLNRKRICKQDTVTFYCYFAMLVSALILQCFFRELAFVGVVTVLAIVVLLFSEQSKTNDRVFQARIGAEEARLEAAQAKEMMLRSQVSPHFIYNALTAIQAQSRFDSWKIRDSSVSVHGLSSQLTK